MIEIDTKKVKEIMINKGLTQSKLSEIIKVSRTRVSKILKEDIARVNYATAYNLAKGLGVDSKDILVERERG